MTRREKIIEGAAAWAGYYRHNVTRFCRDYLHLNLKLFQKIMLTAMMMNTVLVFIGARGIGKTFLSAVFCTIRAILYPGTKICIASGTRGQAINVLEKITLELRPNSPELAAEIDDKQTKINGTDAQIVFKNGSYIKVVTASDSARGNRANILLLDEFRMIHKDTIDTILRKFLTQRRMPQYRELTDAERKIEYNKEKNMTLYLSSAYWVDHWSYDKCKDTASFMLDETRKQFVCGLPYQLSIYEGLLDRDIVADEMAETDFSEIKFSMEYESLFWGESDGAFFDYQSISKNRKIKYPMLPGNISRKLNNAQQIRIAPKQVGEIRVMSADIALMSSKKHDNDATAIFINQMLPTKANRYIHNYIYTDSCEGKRTEEQALMIRKLYDEYACDYLVLDTNGIGLGVYDCLARDIVDSETGEVYPALSCCNNSEMAARCMVPNADKVIWSVKASAQFNSDCAYMLREAFRSGRIRLLENEYDAEESLSDIKGYGALSPSDKVKLQLPYINTTLLIDELTKLQHEESVGRIKIFERAGCRKDRYSSLSYNYYVSAQIENKVSKKQQNSFGDRNLFVVRAPSNIKRKAVSDLSVRNGRSNRNWYE